MGNLHFYAVKDDFILLLEHIFSQTDFRVFESYSEYDCDLREFRKVDDLLAAMPLGSAQVVLRLWSQQVSKEFEIRKITLDPNRVRGHAFRFCFEAWGMIQLVLDGLPASMQIPVSNIGHASEKRARAFAQIPKDLPSIESCNWSLLNQQFRKLTYHISKRLSNSKDSSRPILLHAEGLLTKGYTLS